MAKLAKKEEKKKTPAPRPYDPFGSFYGEMDRLMDSYFPSGTFPAMPRIWRRGGDGGESAMVVPQIDVSENDKAVTVTAELPGIDEDAVEVTLRDGMLTLKGEKSYEKKDEKDEVQVMERRYGSFMRSIRLPEGIDEDKVDAKYDKGILTVTAAKRPEAQKTPRKIKISRY